MTIAGPDAGSRGQVFIPIRGELDIVKTAAPGPLATAAVRGQFVVADRAGLIFLDPSAVCLLMRAGMVARESGSDVVPANSPESILTSLTMLGQAGVPAGALAAG